MHRWYCQRVQLPLQPVRPDCETDGLSENHHLHPGNRKRSQPASFRLAMCAGTARRRELECAGAPQSRQPQHRPQTTLLQRIEVTRVLYLILLCFGTLFGLGAFFLLAGLLRLPTSASTKAVLTVTSRGKSQKGSINAVLFGFRHWYIWTTISGRSWRRS